MQAHRTSFFDGIDDAEVAAAVAHFARRAFPAGTVLLAEGDAPGVMYVLRAGTADVLIADRDGTQHRINSVGPGDTLGEMSLFTGQPVSATVRTTGDAEVLVLNESDLQRLAVTFPRLYRNLGAILSERLARSNRRALRDGAGRVSVLRDAGAPPLLGYALACSVAWHTRRSTLHLLVDDGRRWADELTALARVLPGDALPAPAGGPRADLVVVPPAGPYAPDALARTLELLGERYDHVLVQLGEDAPPLATSARSLRLAGQGAPGQADPVGSGVRALRALAGWGENDGRVGADGAGTVRVPPLSAADEAGLAAGMLSLATDAGRALGWAARELAGLKVGIAFGAGSVRGYAHVGALNVLAGLGVPIDTVAGTSIGAAVGAALAVGFDADGIAGLLDEVGGTAFRLTVPTSSILSSGGVRDGVRRVLGARRFEDLPLPFGVVTADIVSGREVVFRRGLMWPAVLASMSIPGIYPAQRIGNRTLVDGGVLNPVPSNVAADLGADTVIAIKLGNRFAAPELEAESAETAGRAPSVIQAISRSIEMMQSKIVTDSAAAAATIQIEPTFTSVGGWGLRSFTQGRQYIALGEEATRAALPRLRAALPWLES